MSERRVFTLTETYRNLRNESIEGLRYTKLITEIVSKKLTIEKIINIKNPSNDLFIIITVDNKNHCISKHFSFEPEDAVFFRIWLGEDFPDSDYEVFDKRHPEVI